MRKLSFFLAVVLLVTAFAVPASAAQPRAIVAIPGLSFNGNVATCSLSASANYATDEMKATIALYLGSSRIATWVVEGDGYINFSDTKVVTKGYTYTLKVDLTVNGVDFPVSNVSRTC